MQHCSYFGCPLVLSKHFGSTLAYGYLEMTRSQIQFELFNIYLVPHLMCHRTGCEVRKALKKQYYLVNITAAHKKLFP